MAQTLHIRGSISHHHQLKLLHHTIAGENGPLGLDL